MLILLNNNILHIIDYTLSSIYAVKYLTFCDKIISNDIVSVLSTNDIFDATCDNCRRYYVRYFNKNREFNNITSKKYKKYFLVRGEDKNPKYLISSSYSSHSKILHKLKQIKNAK